MVGDIDIINDKVTALFLVGKVGPDPVLIEDKGFAVPVLLIPHGCDSSRGSSGVATGP